ncbi:hypothetical protein BASA81_003077 [Batrachochytrium salamandrivorans]|nr:hypothetical protein BASA81_003077 [Batrachochytrium salamandrivorans]
MGMRVVYMCASVDNRVDLAKQFASAVDPRSCQIVRWRSLPDQVDQIHCVVDDGEDSRCKKLRDRGVEVVSSAWIQACIAQHQLALLPSQLSVLAPSTQARRFHRPGGETWSTAEDNLIRAIRNHLLLNKDATLLEQLLLDRGRSLVDLHDRQGELFGEPKWTEQEDETIRKMQYFITHGNPARVAVLAQALEWQQRQRGRSQTQMQQRLRAHGIATLTEASMRSRSQ